jgi:hypothetical protein
MVSSPEDIVPIPNIDTKADKDRGVLLALRNAASFYQGGKIVNVAGPELMAEAKLYAVYPGFAFVAYPNRDSTLYKERSVSTNFLHESLGVLKSNLDYLRCRDECLSTIDTLL